MKKRLFILIGLILICAVGYAYFGPSGIFINTPKYDLVKKSKISADMAGESTNLLPGQPGDDMAYAIVVMPKSYLPALKRFSRSRMARDLTILPARIGWEEGQMVAIPKQAILKPDINPTSSSRKGSAVVAAGDIPGPMEPKIILRNAALLLLLKGSLGSKVRYQSDRSHLSASSSLHR